MTDNIVGLYSFIAIITCSLFLMFVFFTSTWETNKKYRAKLKELKTFSEKDPLHYFSKSLLKSQNIAEFRSPELIDFYMKLDDYFVNTDLETINKHTEYYKIKRASDTQLNYLMKKLLGMKEKEEAFKIKMEEAEKALDTQEV